MLSRKHRFHGRTSLRYVYSKGQTVRGNLFSVKYAHNSRRDDWRMAVVVSRKVSKSAVVRNRIRRRIYEIIRQNQKAIKNPYDIVVTVFSDGVAELSHQELSDQVLYQLKRTGIFSS